MPAELLEVIKSCADEPSRYALSLTCREFRQACKDPFERFRFADTCAALGHRVLLEWSVDHGAPFDAKTAEVAARHGHVDILKLYLRRKFQIDISSQPVVLHDKALREVVRQWWCCAAVARCRRTLHWLSDGLDPFEMIVSAARGGDVSLVRVLLGERRIQLPALWDRWVFLSVAAAECGHLRVVQDFFELEKCDFELWRIEQRDDGTMPLLDRIIDAALENSHPNVVSWCIAQKPSLVHERLWGRTWLSEKEPSLLTTGSWAVLETTVVEPGVVDQWRGYLEDYFSIMRDHYRDNRSEFVEGLEDVHFRVIQLLFEELGIVKFAEVIRPKRVHHSCLNAKALQWMKEHGILPDFYSAYHRLHSGNLDREMVIWLLNEGVQPEPIYINDAARAFRVDILEMLWMADSSDLVPNNYTIPETLRKTLESDVLSAESKDRYSLVSILKTLQWLKEKGYRYAAQSIGAICFLQIVTDGLKSKIPNPVEALIIDRTANDGGSVYDCFILTLLAKKPQFVKDYLAEIQELELPLSDEVALALSRNGQSLDKNE